MKKLLTTIFATFILVINAQECEYGDYYYWTDKAFVNYYDEDYQEAKEQFKKALELVSFPLGPDLHKALDCAIKTNDKLFAQRLSIMLAKGGVPLEYFNKVSNYPWYKTFLNSYKSYKEEYELEFDKGAKENIIHLRHIDSTFNVKYHSWRSREIELTVSELTTGAQMVVDGFKDHVTKYGFPGDKNLGYYYKDGVIKVYPIQILLTHIYQRGELVYLDELNQISCDGLMSERNIAWIKSNRGFGNSTGVRQEMKVRYNRYRPLNK